MQLPAAVQSLHPELPWRPSFVFGFQRTYRCSMTWLIHLWKGQYFTCSASNTLISPVISIKFLSLEFMRLCVRSHIYFSRFSSTSSIIYSSRICMILLDHFLLPRIIWGAVLDICILFFSVWSYNSAIRLAVWAWTLMNFCKPFDVLWLINLPTEKMLKS